MLKEKSLILMLSINGLLSRPLPITTINIYALGSMLPFDVNAIRCMPYAYKIGRGFIHLNNDINALTKKLKNAKRKKDTDSPVYQLVNGISFQNSVAHQKTDVFREQVEYNNELKKMLAKTRAKSDKKEVVLAEIEKIIETKINMEDEEAGVLIDIMLSFRALSAFERMIKFIDEMPSHVKNTVMVQEQLGFALNRVGEKEEAIRVLDQVLKQNGHSSETYGILGRVYKDKYDMAVAENEDEKSAGFLDKAIQAYQSGFEADWRDAYPGINLLTLLDIKRDTKRLKKMIPVVEYAVERKIQAQSPDYWDYATLLEIAVLADDDESAKENLKMALTCDIEGSWMFKTTLDSLQRLENIRKSKDQDTSIADKYCQLLNKQFKKMERSNE